MIIETIEKLSTESLKRYAHYVTKSRVLPSLDLKPVQRRLLWSMINLGSRPNHNSYKKCASIVGDCLGHYHPHGDCLHGDTVINLLDGTNPTLENLYKSGKEEFWVYSSDKEGNPIPALAHSLRIGQHTNIIYTITLDNGKLIKCTNNHPFKLSNNSYVKAKNLKIGDSLLSLVRKLGKYLNENINENFYHDYEFIKLKEGNFIPTHILIRNTVNYHLYIERCNKILPKDKKGYKIIVSHHKDFNKLNNDPNNFQYTSFSEHSKIHLSFEGKKSNFKNNPSLRSLAKAGFEKFLNTEEKYNKYLENLSKAYYKRISTDKKFVEQCIKNLEIGREKMFSENGIYREKTKLKNQKLMKNYNSNQGKIKWLKIACQCLKENNFLTEELYNKYRILIYNGTTFLKWRDYFDSFDQALREAKDFNHKIIDIKIEILNDKIPMYDLTVDGYENFAIENSIFVHNSAIYDTLVNMINFPNSLIEGRGNFGSALSLTYASSRYTECRTSELFEHIYDEYTKQEGVNEFVNNYDDTLKEPVMIHTKIPLVPLMSVMGIGVGITTSVPTFSFDTVVNHVRKHLNLSSNEVNEYAYNGVLINNKIYPKHEITKINGKSYLHIYELPFKTNLLVLQHPYIQELVCSNQIEIINNSRLKNISIKISAPEEIQKFILDKIALTLSINFNYYWKKLRISNYYQEWVKERLRFIKTREYFKLVQDWKSELTKLVLTNLNINSKDNIKESISPICELYYKNEFNKIPEEAKIFIPSQEEFTNLIQNKSINQIKSYEDINIPKFSLINEDQCKQILINEIERLDKKLFTQPTKPGKLVFSKFEGKVKRYVIIKDNNVVVNFRQTSRIVNWEVTYDKKVNFIYNDSSKDTMPYHFYGMKSFKDDNINEKHVVGFSIEDRPVVVITETNNLIVCVRMSVVKEPIKIAFPANKILVDDKEYIVKSGLQLANIKNYKILET